MLDVHPPHHPTHTWKDFFIHIATITVGLLIAVGLEQTVEAMHRRHEREELRRALEAESRQIVLDTTNVEDGTTLEIQWSQKVERQLSDAVLHRSAAGQLPPRPRLEHPWDVPDNPVYTAAKASGKLALLDEDEVIAYGELDGLTQRVNSAYTEITTAHGRNTTLERELGFGRPTGFSVATDSEADDLRRLAESIAEGETAMMHFRYWSRQARGGTTAMLAGERDLHAIERAERQFDQKP